MNKDFGRYIYNAVLVICSTALAIAFDNILDDLFYISVLFV